MHKETNKWNVGVDACKGGYECKPRQSKYEFFQRKTI